MHIETVPAEAHCHIGHSSYFLCETSMHLGEFMPEQMSGAPFCTLIKASIEHMMTLAMRPEKGLQTGISPGQGERFPPISHDSLGAQLQQSCKATDLFSCRLGSFLINTEQMQFFLSSPSVSM